MSTLQRRPAAAVRAGRSDGRQLQPTLLALGIKIINLGPTLPAFLTPAAIDIVVERFGLGLIGNDPVADLQDALVGGVR